MLCRAGSCQRAATLRVCIDAKPVSTACSKACAEQIRAELIGMPKRAADSDDVDDSRDDADRAREEQQRQKQRFLDFVTLGEWAARLGKIRADVYTLTPIEVSTDTMLIGAKFDDGGATMASRLDAILQTILKMQMTLLRGGDSDLGRVRAQVRRLRDEIAEDETLARFVQQMPDLSGESEMAKAYRQIPDDARLLMAYRLNPVQRIAVFPVEWVGRNQIWAYNGRIRIEATEYAYDGKLLGKSPYEYAPGAVDGLAYNSLGQIIAASEPHGLWAITPSPTISRLDLFLRSSRMGYFNVKEGEIVSHSSAPNKLFTLTIAARKKHRFESCRLVSANSSTIGAVAELDPSNVMFIKLSIDHDNAIISDAEEIYIMDRSFRENMIALDSDGNVWVYHSTNNHVGVYNAGGQQIATIDDIAVSSMCAAEDGVWITYVDISTRNSYCANYRLAPAAAYNRGLGQH